MIDPGDLVAYCGLYCSTCSFKLAINEDVRAHVLYLPSRYDKAEDAGLAACLGCRGELDDGNDLCTIPSCGHSRGLEHCGACAEFPCRIVEGAAGDGVPHHAQTLWNLRRLGDVGTSAGLSEQATKWTCACDARRSCYLKTCPKRGVRLPALL